jgi:hypothetical protein
MTTKKMRGNKKMPTVEELREIFGKPPKEVEVLMRKMLNWVAWGLPKPTSDAELSSRCNW